MEMSDQDITDNKFEVAGFIKKTFEILNNPQYNKIIFWTFNGKEFIIKDISKFQQIVLPKFFRHRNINSFIRQLNMYGFHKGKKDSSKCIFSHPFFAKDKEQFSKSSRTSLHLIKRKFKTSQNGDEPKLSAPVIPVVSKNEIVVKVNPPTPITTPHKPEPMPIQKAPAAQTFSTPLKNTKYIISTHDLINTGPNISFIKLSHIEIHSKISFDSDREDCLSIEDQIERNNARIFNNRIMGISLINTVNFLDEIGLI